MRMDVAEFTKGTTPTSFTFKPVAGHFVESDLYLITMTARDGQGGVTVMEIGLRIFGDSATLVEVIKGSGYCGATPGGALPLIVVALVAALALRRRGVALLALLCAAPLCAQARYSVTSGSAAFTPLPVVPLYQTVDLSVEPESPRMRIPGFQFEFFGTFFSEFIIYRGGRIGMGNQSRGKAALMDHNDISPQNFTAEQPLQIAPLWTRLQWANGSAVLWDYQGGVLTTEWRELEDTDYHNGTPPFPRVSFQCVLDTNTGQIEFRYAAATAPPKPVPWTVALHHEAGSQGKHVVAGMIPGCVGADGTMPAWPSDRWVRFAPQFIAGAGPPLISVSRGTPAAGVNYRSDVSGPVGTALAALPLRLSISDPNGQAVTLSAAAMFPPADGLNLAEFGSPATASPYTVQPASGSLGSLQYILLTATDASGGTTIFAFSLSSHAVPIENGEAENKEPGCSVASTAAAWPAALIVPALAMRRRKAADARARAIR
jgi:hypothetical protein